MDILEAQSTDSTKQGNRLHQTVEAFYRASDAGVFDEPHRIEVIRGELRVKEKVNPPHAFGTERTAALLRCLLPGLYVREEKPLHLDFDGEPMPDVQVVVGQRGDYATRHPVPADVRLLVEVADATARYDTGDKALLYARAGIADYGVCDLNNSVVHVFREPTPNGYGAHARHGAGETIAPLCAPQVALRVEDLLPRLRETE